MKTVTKLQFKDNAIAKIKVDELDFSYVNKAGETKFRKHQLIPFEVAKKSILKGLKLCVHKDTGSFF